jgi:hypothetical protein
MCGLRVVLNAIDELKNAKNILGKKGSSHVARYKLLVNSGLIACSPIRTYHTDLSSGV